jgi:hypothetical protein
MTHAFTLQIAGVDPKRPDYEDALYEAGCDDALIAVVDDEVFLDFDREANTLDEAIRSAKRDVQRAGAMVIRVLPPPG